MRLPWRPTLVRLGRRLPPSVQRAVNAARGIELPALLDRPPGSTVAVLAPHPDDELVGCGGTIRKHLDAGDRVRIVFLTSGQRSASLAGGPAREAEAREAARALGVPEADLDFLGLPDGGVDGAEPRVLAEAIRRSGADLVYAPNPIDAHRDHVATCRLLGRVMSATPTVRRVALYEVWSPVQPNVLVDVSGQIDDKLRALACYATANEVVDYVHAARGLAAYRAAHGLHGRGYAEAFTVLGREPFLELLQRLDRR